MTSWPSGTIQSAEAISRIYFQTHNGDEVETHPHHDQIEERNAGSEPPLNHDNEMVNADVEGSSRTKRRKLNSKVWKEFTKYKEDGIEWAVCKYCGRKFNGSSKKGTTHLKNHLERRHRVERNPGEGAVVETDDLIAPIVNKEKSVIDQELNHLDAARLIIKYGFSSLKSIKADILHVYKEEKEKLRGYFNKLQCRFHLKFEWFDIEYILVVLYFIDDSWEPKKKIIYFEYDDKCERDFSEAVQGLLLDLSVDKNICSTVTGICKDDLDIFYINFWIGQQALLPFNKHLLTIQWLVDNLKCYVRNGPKWIPDLFNEIKKSFNYVRDTLSSEQRFLIALNKAKSMGKKVTVEGLPKRWFSDELERLESALGYKEAFCELERMDPNFKLNLTEEEWDKATAAVKCVKVLKEAADNLSRSKYTTANMYFPHVCDIYKKLLQWEESANCYVCEIALCMKEKYFDDYWSKCHLVLVIAVVLDPRFKMDIVIGWYMEIYGRDNNAPLKKIIKDVANVFNEYAKVPRMLDALGRPCTSSNSELDRYLNEPRIPPVEEFDILVWWRVNFANFPTLARMARDFLAVPVSTPSFTSDSCYLSSELYNIFHSDGPDVDIKKALVCTKSWLETSENN